METKMIGNKITEARKKLNISQAQLAELLFISAQAVGKWERGESMPDITTFNRLAEILGVDLNYFSGSFQSANTEIASNKSSSKQTDDFQSEEQKKRLSWDMSRGNWMDADFSGLNNLHGKFSSANMQKCKFIGSDLSGLHLKSNHVDRCDFSSSNIRGSHIQNTNLTNNRFENSSLKETEFSGSNINDCDFSRANFTGVVFKFSAFVNNAITNAVLDRTSFIDSQIADIVFEDNIDDCYFENCSFKKVTFRNATLINTFFKNKSLKGIRFIDCQTDRMTYEFLKNGKADLTGITMIIP